MINKKIPKKKHIFSFPDFFNLKSKHYNTGLKYHKTWEELIQGEEGCNRNWRRRKSLKQRQEYVINTILSTINS